MRQLVIFWSKLVISLMTTICYHLSDVIMKSLLTVSVLIYSLLYLVGPTDACSAFPDGHMGVVLEVNKTTNSLTISDGQTGSPITFSVEDTVLSTVEWLVLSVQQAIFVRYRVESDQLIATEIKKLN